MHSRKREKDLPGGGRGEEASSLVPGKGSDPALCRNVIKTVFLVSFSQTYMTQIRFQRKGNGARVDESSPGILAKGNSTKVIFIIFVNLCHNEARRPDVMG